MYLPRPEAAAPALRHPDDPASYVSGASQVPASMVATNPWLTRPIRPERPVLASSPMSAEGAAAESVSRSSAYAEPPTDQSRVRAMQQVSPPEDDLRFGGFYGNAYGATLPKADRTLDMPTIALPSRASPRRSSDPRDENEFDRLIREKLEGQHSARTQFKKTVTERAQGHLSWQWQTLDAVIDGTFAMWEGVRSTGGRLLGMVPSIPDAANCKRMTQAKPIVIDIGEDGLPQDPGDEFSDLLSGPAATREPIPARIPRAEIPPFTPVGREGLTVMDVPEPGPTAEVQEKTSKPKDTASALSVSSKMTSSAAALLGGFSKKPASTAEATEPLSEKKVIRPGDSKSCIAPTSAMNSSAASSLGALFAKQSQPSAEEGMTTINEEQEAPVEEAKTTKTVTPKASGKAKSVVVQSSAMSSSVAGALGALTARPAAAAAEEELQQQESKAPAPKKSAGAKSVLNQSTVMSSSAAGALGGLLSKAPKSTPAVDDATPETSDQKAEAPPPKKSAAAKSVLNQSTVMSSSAAGALGGLLAKSKPAEPPATPAPAPAEQPAEPSESPREATAKAKGRPADRQSALAASTVMTSSAAATLGALGGGLAKAPPKAAGPKEGSGTAPVAKTKSKPKAGQSVISGLNTSSSASALLGPMMQAKK